MPPPAEWKSTHRQDHGDSPRQKLSPKRFSRHPQSFQEAFPAKLCGGGHGPNIVQWRTHDLLESGIDRSSPARTAKNLPIFPS